ncbi:MAG: hypothetical protein H0T89_14785 [Deltaproteobacteria bacterium]|nr:hypothetical protein [Deltaproteobacteria bacterium]MDQ3295477.1 hypothetical protein [Myxococcota bacterium]
MRHHVTLIWFLVLGCGGGSSGSPDAGVDAGVDAPPSNCQPLGAQGQFIRRAGNPRLLAGRTFGDGKQDLSIADPDVHWDGTRYRVYYSATHATTFAATDKVPVVRHASSADRMTWTVDDAPVFTISADTAAWDRLHTEAPTVVENPAAPADRRYLMLYAGASRAFPFAGYAFPEYNIGAAFSADGITFTRITAAQSPHAKAGLVLTGQQAYPGSTGAIVSDPDVAIIDGVYHVWFTSFACTGPSCGTPTDSGIAHATSPDGITWTVREAPVRSLLRASADRKSGGQQPSVIHDAVHCRWELWLTNDLGAENDAQPTELANTMGVYHADSVDGLNWSINYARARDLQWSATEPGERLGLRTGIDVAQNTTGRLMLYVGYDDQNVPAGYTIPDRTTAGSRSGVMTLNVATRDLP